MAKFMENYKIYCKKNGYKQKFVALKTDMTETKISRLFKGEQEANEQDMERLSEAFMKTPAFLCRKNSMKRYLPRKVLQQSFIWEKQPAG